MDHLEETPNSHSVRSNDDEVIHPRRGWWDYAPGSEKPAPSSQRLAGGIPHTSSFQCALLRTVGRLWKKREDWNIAAARKPSLHSESPIPQPPRPPPARTSGNPVSQVGDRAGSSRSRSPVPSFTAHHIGLRPRMVLFREVMRDEVNPILHAPFHALISKFTVVLHYFHHRLMCRCDGS